MESVKLLTRKALDRIKRIRSTNQLDWNVILKPNADRTGQYTLQRRYLYDNPILMLNPQYHTSILYWNSLYDFDEKKEKTGKDDKEEKDDIFAEILRLLEAYPEGPVAIHKWRTPCHAAASVGNHDKLRRLLTDIKKRYKDEVNKPKNQKH